MTDEQFIELKQDYIDHIKRYVVEEGGIFPHISVFADSKNPKIEEEKKPAIIHIPIPDEFMNDEGKETFLKEIVPMVFSKIKEKFIPYGVGWASEAWMRTIEKGSDFDIDKDDYKKLPIKKEIVIITVETEDSKDALIYDINREGKQINSDGELVDKVSLVLNEDMKNPDGLDGRFSGLLKKFKD
jgi:hypothetical protein